MTALAHYHDLAGQWNLNTPEISTSVPRSKAPPKHFFEANKQSIASERGPNNEMNFDRLVDPKISWPKFNSSNSLNAAAHTASRMYMRQTGKLEPGSCWQCDLLPEGAVVKNVETGV